MSMRKKFVIRTVDDDPEKKHRGVRQVRVWVWILLLLSFPTFGLVLFHRSPSPPSVATVLSTVPEAQPLLGPGGELDVDVVSSPQGKWTLCSVVKSESAEHKLALKTWLTAGASEVVLVSGSKLGEGGQDAAGVRRVIVDNVESVSSVLQICEKEAKGNVVALVASESLLLPSFGAVLESIAGAFKSQSFLVMGSKAIATGSKWDEVCERGEQSMRREWLNGKKRLRGSDVLIWKGSWENGKVKTEL